jgi:hypothetical protein
MYFKIIFRQIFIFFYRNGVIKLADVSGLEVFIYPCKYKITQSSKICYILVANIDNEC